ncbi:MAG: hypothetical protein ACLFQW_04080 [Spirochaetaceae bacterium]
MAKQNELVKRLQTRINNDPLISDPSNIFFSVEKRGPLFKKRTCIFIEGSAINKLEQQQIEKAAHEEIRDCEIVNRIKIPT